jgi:hypothetical protein
MEARTGLSPGFPSRHNPYFAAVVAAAKTAYFNLKLTLLVY